TTVIAAGLVDTGTINLTGGSAAVATLNVAAAAPAVLSGVVNLGGDALLEFGGTASIGTIASGATLNIDGTQAFVAAAGVGTASNTGLTGLSSIAGSFLLRHGGSLTTTGALSNSGSLLIDSLGGQGGGGSSLTVTGTLTNSNFVDIGTTDMVAPSTVTVQGLANTGTLDLFGNSPNQATLNVAAAAPAVLSGVVNLGGDAL